MLVFFTYTRSKKIAFFLKTEQNKKPMKQFNQQNRDFYNQIMCKIGKRNKKEFLKLIGKAVLHEKNNRIGYIKKIAFRNKNYSILWLLFAYDRGEYIVPLEELKTTQLNLFN